MTRITDEQIANNYGLWCEYIDNVNPFSEDVFNEMSEEEKMDLIMECYRLNNQSKEDCEEEDD